MLETQERFNSYYAVQESFKSGIQKLMNIIPVIKERADIISKLEKEEKKYSEINEQIKGLKTSLKLVEKEKVKLKNKEEVKKALEDVISIKEKELEKVDDESDDLSSLLSECENEIEEYSMFVRYLFDLDNEYDFINAQNMDFEKVSRNEFIAYLFVWSNFGDMEFPRFNKKKMHPVFHGIIDATEDAMENGWDSFVKWIEEN